MVRRITLVWTAGRSGRRCCSAPACPALSANPVNPPSADHRRDRRDPLLQFCSPRTSSSKLHGAIVRCTCPSPGQPRVKTWQNLWPLCMRSAFRASTVAAWPPRQATGARILFVEDEESISEPFAEALRRAGFEPLVTGTAAGALGWPRTLEPDLVMLDLALPDGDGRDVCRELRRRSDVPIVMLTARGTEMDKIVGLELGADDYVVKPFSAARGDLADPGGAAPQRPRARTAPDQTDRGSASLELDRGRAPGHPRRQTSSSSRARSSTCSPSCAATPGRWSSART